MRFFDPDLFWTFSARQYALEGVKGCCLALQNDHGVDVNLLLLCHWLDSQELVIASETMNGLITLSDNWQAKHLAPQRAKRAALEKGSRAYQTALVGELATEKREQRAFITFLNKPDTLEAGQLFSDRRNIVSYGAMRPFPFADFVALTDRQL